MQSTNQIDHSRNKLLRFVFNDKVVSYNLADDETLEDIALEFRKLSPRPSRKPYAIDVTLGADQSSFRT